MQPASFVGAGTLELQEFSLPNPQYCEETLYSGSVRLVRLFLGGFHE
jgi:hypothetical protein